MCTFVEINREWPSSQMGVSWRRKLHKGHFVIGPLFDRMCVLVSHVWPFVTAWTGACRASLSMGFSRQEDWRLDRVGCSN